MVDGTQPEKQLREGSFYYTLTEAEFTLYKSITEAKDAIEQIVIPDLPKQEDGEPQTDYVYRLAHLMPDVLGRRTILEKTLLWLVGTHRPERADLVIDINNKLIAINTLSAQISDTIARNTPGFHDRRGTTSTGRSPILPQRLGIDPNRISAGREPTYESSKQHGNLMEERRSTWWSPLISRIRGLLRGSNNINTAQEAADTAGEQKDQINTLVPQIEDKIQKLNLTLTHDNVQKDPMYYDYTVQLLNQAIADNTLQQTRQYILEIGNYLLNSQNVELLQTLDQALDSLLVSEAQTKE